METMKREMINQPNITQGMSQGLSYMAEIPISKWGNSQGIRIPRTVTEQLNISVNDMVEMSVRGNEIIIKKREKYKNLKERLESFYNQPIDSIFIESTEEVDWGTPEGEEVW